MSHRRTEGKVDCDDAHSFGTLKCLRTILTMACTSTQVFQVPYESLCCTPVQYPSIVVVLAELMLLVTVLFRAAPEMIALPFKDIMSRNHG